MVKGEPFFVKANEIFSEITGALGNPETVLSMDKNRLEKLIKEAYQAQKISRENYEAWSSWNEEIKKQVLTNYARNNNN